MIEDKDPELAKERAVRARLDELSAMTVAEFIQCLGVVPVRIGDVAAARDFYLLGNLTPAVEDARVNIDLQALIEAAAEWLGDLK